MMDEMDPDKTASTSDVPRKSNHFWLADLALLSVALIWGINVPIFKFAIERVDKFHFNATRLIFSAVTLAICAWLESRKYRSDANAHAAAIADKTADRPPTNQPSKSKVNWTLVVIFCFTTGFFYQFLFLFGMDRTSSGNAALILASMPMWTAIIASLFSDEKLGKLEWLGLSITFCGTIIVILQKENPQSLQDFGFSIALLAGNLLMLSAAIAWSAGTVVGRGILKHSIKPIFLAFLACGMTLPLHLLISNSLSPMPARLWEPDILACLIYSGVFSTGFSYAMWNFGVSRVGAAHAAVFQNLIPVISLIVGFTVLGEVPLVGQYLGGFLIIGGLVTMRASSRRNKERR